MPLRPSAAARSISTVSPPPGVSVAVMVPPIASTNPRATDKAEADADAVVVVAEPLERLEQLLLGAARDARDPRRSTAISTRSPTWPGVDPHQAVGRVPQRVVDQVGQHPLEQTAVGHHHGVADFDLHPVESATAKTRDSPADSEQRALHRLLQVDPAQLGPDHSGRQPRRVEQVADQRGQLVDRLLDGGQQFGGVLGGEVDVVAAQAGHRGLGGGQWRAQVVADRGQQRAAQFVGLRDGLGLAGLLGQLALLDQARGLFGDRAQHPAVAGGQFSSGHQHPEFVVADLDRGVGGVDVHAGIRADTSDDGRPLGASPAAG